MKSNKNAQRSELYDMDGLCIDVECDGGSIRLAGWRITEDSVGKPYQTYAKGLNLSRRQAVELARRLFIAATE